MTATAITTHRAVDESHILAAALFLASTAIVLLTLNAVIVATWIGCWVFAVTFSSRAKAAAAFLFVLGIVMFYPDESTAFRGVHQKGVVLASALFLTALWYLPIAVRDLRRSHGTAFLVTAWIAWGLLAYIPVAAAWLWSKIVVLPLPDALAALQHETSGIKTAAPIICAAFATLLAVAALRDFADLRALRRALEIAVIVLATLSLAEWGVGRHFVPIDPEWLIAGTRRLEGFSTIDSNGLGRLLLFPALLFVSAALSGRLGKRGWIALALALSSIVLTQSRTTYISLTLGIAVLALLNIGRLRLWWFIGVSAVWVALVARWSNLGQSFSQGSERLALTTFELRMELWRGVLHIMRESPFFGAHPSGYIDRMKQLGLLENQINSAHNLYLAIGVEWGVPMVVLALAVMILAVRHGWRAFMVARSNSHLIEVRTLAAATVASTVAYAAHGMTEIVAPFTLFMLLGCGFAARRHAELVAAVRSRSATSSPRRRRRRLAAA